MRTRAAIHLPLMAAVAGTLAACDRGGGGATAGDGTNGWNVESPTRLCVDQNQNRLPDIDCQNGYHGGGFHRWYYLSRGGFVPGLGRYVTGGALTPSLAEGAYHSTAASMSEARSIQRGGFGDLGGRTAGTSRGGLGGFFSGFHGFRGGS